MHTCLYTSMNHSSPSPFSTFFIPLDVHIVIFTNCCCLGAVSQVIHAHGVLSWLTSKPAVMLKSSNMAWVPANRLLWLLHFAAPVMVFKHWLPTAHIALKHTSNNHTLIPTLIHTLTEEPAATWNMFWKRSSVDLVLRETVPIMPVRCAVHERVNRKVNVITAVITPTTWLKAFDRLLEWLGWDLKGWSLWRWPFNSHIHFPSCSPSTPVQSEGPATQPVQYLWPTQLRLVFQWNWLLGTDSSFKGAKNTIVENI